VILELNLNPETSTAVTEMAAAGPARMKVLDSLATTGPSTPAENSLSGRYRTLLPCFADMLKMRG
jgi:hypothetical protein